MSEFKDLLNKIIADGRVDEHELVQLNNWLQKQNTEDNDFFDLKTQIKSILADGEIDFEEHEEIWESIQDIIAYRED